MQLTLKVNNCLVVKGALRTRGVLSARIMLSVPPDKEPSGDASIYAFDLSSSGVSEWAAGSLSVGDKIEIHLLPGGDADPPSSTRELSEIQHALFSDDDQAHQALRAAHVCKEQLEMILRNAGRREPHPEALKVQKAIVAIVRELGERLITPTLLRHPELASEAKELGLTD
jgi:hypothetical protein